MDDTEFTKLILVDGHLFMGHIKGYMERKNKNKFTVNKIGVDFW